MTTPRTTSVTSPYLTAEEGARYVRSASSRAFRMWLQAHGVRVYRFGNRVLVKPADLDAALAAIAARPRQRKHAIRLAEGVRHLGDRSE